MAEFLLRVEFVVIVRFFMQFGLMDGLTL